MKQFGVTIATLMLLLADGHTWEAQPGPPNDMSDAAEVMRRVVDTYHSFSTYSDQGTSVDRVFGRKGAGYKLTIDFETLFKRPGKLRFAWTVHRGSITRRHVIWSDGATAWSAYAFHSDNPRRVRDLGLLLSGVIAPSESTGYTIPILLTDEVRGVRLDELRDLRIAKMDTVEGVECFVLAGYYSAGTECKVWVGRHDHLVRRIQKRNELGTHEEERTRILVNEEIGDSRFSEQGR